MQAKNVVIGESYRHKEHPSYGWAKAVKVLRPKQDENTNTFIVVKCEYTQQKNDVIGLVKYFKPSDLLNSDK